MLICAALLVQLENVKDPVIVPCIRHGDGILLIRQLGFAPKTKYKILKQGFVTHKGEFLDRYESYEHAIDCGQLSQTVRWHKEDSGETELYSEDLY